jgi:hypothetical protein
MTTNNTLTSASYTALPGVSITFTPGSSVAHIDFTAAGYGYTGSNTIVEFLVQVNGAPVGGTMEKVGVLTAAASLTTWSVAFSKNVTVNAGSANTIDVQYRTTAVSGTRGIVINGANNDATHATITSFYK